MSSELYGMIMKYKINKLKGSAKQNLLKGALDEMWSDKTRCKLRSTESIHFNPVLTDSPFIQL